MKGDSRSLDYGSNADSVWVEVKLEGAARKGRCSCEDHDRPPGECTTGRSLQRCFVYRRDVGVLDNNAY